MPSSSPEVKKKKKKKGKKYRRRMRRIRRICIAAGAVLLAAALIFALNWALIGGRLYSISLKEADFSGMGLKSCGQVPRLRNLTTLSLSDNGISDVSPLKSLTKCAFIDLTDNPVTDESFAALQQALPSCVILSEARDDLTTEMALAGFSLPDTETLIRALSAKRYLTMVDLRATDLSEADISALREALPHVNFISGGDISGRTVVSASGYQDAVSALGSLSGNESVAVLGCAFTPGEYRDIAARFPGLDVDCLISLYGKSVSNTVSYLDLTDVTVDAALEDSLRLFPALKELDLGNMQPTAARRIRDNLDLDRLTYRYNGSTISPEAVSADLRGRGSLEAEELRTLLEDLPSAEEIWMDGPDETVLSVIAPYRKNVNFYYDVTILDRVFSTSAEHIDLGASVTDSAVDDVLDALTLFPNLKEVYMYESELSQASMDRMFDGRKDLFFGWTIHMCRKKYNIRTDATAFSTLIGAPMNYYTQNDLYQLRYCKKLLGLDLGHNAITDIGFIENMPSLRVLILADNDLTDISPLAELEDLEYLEIFMNYHLTDYSPLSGLQNLKDLNIRCPGARKLTLTADPFLTIDSLERFWGTSRVLSDDEVSRLTAALPDCQVMVTSTNSTDEGWRDNGKYKIIKRMFENGVYEEPFAADQE